MQTYKGPTDANNKFLNSHAVVMAIARSYGLEINLVRNLISAWFFLIILKFIFTLIFEIKIYERKFFDTNSWVRSLYHIGYMQQSLSFIERVWHNFSEAQSTDVLQPTMCNLE